jgi:hypothetical protein
MAILKDSVVQGKMSVTDISYLSDTNIGGSTTNISSTITTISSNTTYIGGPSKHVYIGRGGPSGNSASVHIGGTGSVITFESNSSVNGNCTMYLGGSGKTIWLGTQYNDSYGGNVVVGGPSSVVTLKGSILTATISPNGTANLGTTSSRFSEIYATKMYASTGFFQDSDINKKNVLGEISLERAYELVDKCQEILYTLKDDQSNKEQIGLIAQEVKQFFPEIVAGEEGDYTLDYSRLTVVILRVLKDVINRLSKLENKQ